MDYRGGTYISQTQAATPLAALKRWAKTIKAEEIANFGEHTKVSLIKATLDENDSAVPLTGIKNVWCFTALLRGHTALINFVRTDNG